MYSPPAALEPNGFSFVRGLLSLAEREPLLRDLGPVDGAGRRGVIDDPLVCQLAHSQQFAGLMSACLGAAARPVRAIYFDKSTDANWVVPWHQDLSIAVASRCDVPGYAPWTVKDGIPHVQPPVAILHQMLTLRLHLDDCDESNGALRVIPGSHLLGRLDATQVQALRREQLPVTCSLNAGDALLMRPLLVHTSGRSRSAGRRRVLHLEYAACELPEPLRWYS